MSSSLSSYNQEYLDFLLDPKYAFRTQWELDNPRPEVPQQPFSKECNEGSSWYIKYNKKMKIFYDENNVWLRKRTEAEMKFEQENLLHKVELPDVIKEIIQFHSYWTKETLRVEEKDVL